LSERPEQLDTDAGSPASPEPAAEQMYSGALDRIRRTMLVLAVVATVGCWWRFGWRLALGMALGCAVAYLNFQWLKSGVEALADRIVQAGKSQSGKGMVFRFLLRYVLMGLVAYGILTVSPASLYGLFVGLFLPVAAIACEAAYEAYVALARGL
jgi:ATP synthase I chain